ncbi:MAG: hypothetical protein OEM52_08240 [bacterium]|nr:hypothetical protein [bacterium]
MNLFLINHNPSYQTSYQPGFYAELARQSRILVVYQQKWGDRAPEYESPQKIADNFWIVYRRPFAPYRLMLFSERLAQWDRTLFDRQMKRYCQLLGWSPDIVEFTHPIYREHYHCKTGTKKVFWLIDHYSEVPGNKPVQVGYLAANEKESARNADLVIATARELVNRFGQYAKQIRFLPNSADRNHFQPRWLRDAPVPERIKKIPRPIFGYAGNINAISDWKSLRLLAQSRPNYSFVLFGSMDGPREFYASGDFAQAMLLPNIHYMGKVPNEELAAMYTHFDVGLVLDAINEFSLTRNQNKIYQYLLAGLPVTGPFAQPDYESFSSLLHLFRDPRDWPELCDAALQTNDEAHARIRRAYAEQIDMEQIIRFRISLYEALLTNRPLPEFEYPFLDSVSG